MTLEQVEHLLPPSLENFKQSNGLALKFLVYIGVGKHWGSLRAHLVSKVVLFQGAKLRCVVLIFFQVLALVFEPPDFLR
jgi:hypothetical protein